MKKDLPNDYEIDSQIDNLEHFTATTLKIQPNY